MGIIQSGNTSLLVLAIAISLFFLITGTVLLVIGFRITRSDNPSSRLDAFIQEQRFTKNTSKNRMVLKQTFSTVFMERTAGSGLKKVIAYLGRFTPKHSIDSVDKKLAIVHNPLNIRAREFFAIRIIILILGIGLASLINIQQINVIRQLLSFSSGGMQNQLEDMTSPSMVRIYLGVIIVIFFYLLPIAWLNYQERQAKADFQRSFPDALDLLSVCADAGLGFEQALQKVGDFMHNNVGIEFRKVISEMEVGISRADALRNMKNRLELNELSGFVSIIIQSETLGMRTADVLHSQAEQFRLLRHLRARELANKLPAKMVVPLAFFILPALLSVIIGPLIPRLLTIFD